MSDDRRERCQRCGHTSAAHTGGTYSPQCGRVSCDCPCYQPPIPQAEDRWTKCPHGHVISLTNCPVCDAPQAEPEGEDRPSVADEVSRDLEADRDRLRAEVERLRLDLDAAREHLRRIAQYGRGLRTDSPVLDTEIDQARITSARLEKDYAKAD